MKGAGRNAELIAEAIEYIQRGLDLLNRVERTAEPISEVMPAQIGPWTCGEDLAYSMVEDAQADLDGVLVHLDAGRGLFAGKRVFSREAEKYLDDLHVKYDDEDLDLDEYPEYDPLVFPGDVPEEDMKIIRALAELEREHIALDRRIGKIDISDFLNLDEVTSRKFDHLIEKGIELREELLQGSLAAAVLDYDDDVEDMKKMASILLFLYTAERQQAENEERKPDEDYYYAGSYMYKHAVVEQLSAEDDDDWNEEDWEEDDLDDDDWDDGDEDE